MLASSFFVNNSFRVTRGIDVIFDHTPLANVTIQIKEREESRGDLASLFLFLYVVLKVTQPRDSSIIIVYSFSMTEPRGSQLGPWVYEDFLIFFTKILKILIFLKIF